MTLIPRGTGIPLVVSCHHFPRSKTFRNSFPNVICASWITRPASTKPDDTCFGTSLKINSTPENFPMARFSKRFADVILPGIPILYLFKSLISMFFLEMTIGP